MIRLAIIDDHPVFREGLRRILERAPSFAVMWESDNVADLAQKLEQEPIDVLLMDLYIGPDDDTLAAARDVRERFPEVRVIVVSASLDWDSVTAARQAGASGYLPKDLSVEDMIAGIRALADPNLGRMSFSDRVKTTGTTRGAGLVASAGLTRREREVLFEMVYGHSNRDIAARLGISVTTVNKHVHHILSKLKAKTRAQVIARVRGRTAPLVPYAARTTR
jgi:DNA-binding NarL/FixJ family response regulator